MFFWHLFISHPLAWLFPPLIFLSICICVLIFSSFGSSTPPIIGRFLPLIISMVHFSKQNSTLISWLYLLKICSEVVFFLLFLFFFFFLLIITRSCRLAEIQWSVCISKSSRTSSALSRTDSGLCIYHLFLWSNVNFLHNSLWITFPTQSCLFLYSFYAICYSSLVCSKNGSEDLTRETAQVFILFIRFLQYSLVLNSFSFP